VDIIVVVAVFRRQKVDFGRRDDDSSNPGKLYRPAAGDNLPHARRRSRCRSGNI
jgi:hypothetical protein